MVKETSKKALTPLFFETPEQFRAWLHDHHASETELLVGYYKKETRKPSMTWPESVDEALSYGWIDGVRKRIDEESYSIRFTPRKKGSIWSTVNINRVAELEAMGRMQPAGRRAFEARTEAKSNVYAYEQDRATVKLDEAYEQQFQENPQAWTFFKLQAPSYQRTISWWVMSAKKEETRQRRLAQLIADSAEGRRVQALR